MSKDPSVEIIVLGKGVGESVLVRVGDQWVIVDSFHTTAPGSTDPVPAPLAYLRQHDINPAGAVRAVVLTHLHADHCRGIDEVVRDCPDANFFLPAAVPDAAWGRLLAIAVPAEDRRALADVTSAYRYAHDDNRFRTTGATGILDLPTDVVRVIGPSQQATHAARAALQDQDLPGARKILNENYTSIVLLVCAGPAVALLGADMDADAMLGWPRLLQEHRGKDWIKGVGYVKVPHHGSVTAYLAAMYNDWTKDPVGVLTPNGSRLPKGPMITTLAAATRGLFLAGPPRQADLCDLDTDAPSETFVVRATHGGVPGSVWHVDPPSHPHQVL